MSWIMDTLWLNWKLDQLPEDRPSREIVSHGMKRVSSSMAPLSPTVWTELRQASFSSWTARVDFHNTVACTTPQFHVFFLYNSCVDYMLISPLFVCVCAFCLCVQATGFQCTELWLWAAVAGWPAEAVCWVGQCSGRCHLWLSQPPAGQIGGNTDCWGAQLWYKETN